MKKKFFDLLVSNGTKPRKILHIGANRGQEASLYNDLNIEGWHIEAIPSVYTEYLIAACKKFPCQHAINACLSDKDGQYVDFNIASNQGQSSSILDLGRHAIAYPNIKYEQSLRLKTTTVDSLIAEGVIPDDMDFLLIDAQGAESLILDGAKRLLQNRFLVGLQIETATVPLYENGATYLDICQKLLPFDFYLRSCEFNEHGWTDTLFMRPWWTESFDKSHLRGFDVLRPKPSPKKLIRIGGDRDGAYILPDDLESIAACFSPGVGNRKDFEDELLGRFGIPSHMCDFSSDVDKFKTPLIAGQTFRKVWLDIDNTKNSISLEEWVNELTPDPMSDLMLQMDIEGAEYRNLLATPQSVLCRFRIIILELHRFGVCKKTGEFAKELGPLLAHLDMHFVCVHAHPNNCCGDFLLPESGMNVPDVIELTFLRRDRWDGVATEALHPPMLPHPFDIVNVPGKPSLFLNETWLESGVRAPESTIRMLEDQVAYLTGELKKAKTQVTNCDSAIVLQLHQLAQQIDKAIPSSSQTIRSIESELDDLATGKRFVLSSSYGSCPKQGIVENRSPFFFHTGQGNNQSITIDLETPCQLFILVVNNRTDTCKERARCLFYVTHDQPVANLTEGFPLVIDQDFLTGVNSSHTILKGKVSRYITIFSPENTYLHFSSIEILGKSFGNNVSNVAKMDGEKQQAMQGNLPRIELIDLDRTNPESRFLLKYQKKVFSQHGEEGIIEKCFDIMGVKNKWCVEFGAWDGIHLSNTCYFLKDLGWSGLQIEGNEKKYLELKRNFSGYNNVISLHGMVGYEKGVNTIEDILKETVIPCDFDFISIDIDGNDWYVWESMIAYRPRLVIIEYNPTIPNQVIFVQNRDMEINQGCSAAALIELAKQKNYELVCLHGCNAYFVVKEEFEKFGIRDNSLNAMRIDSRGRIWNGYDGTIYNTLKYLTWKNMEVGELDLQKLEKRCYP